MKEIWTDPESPDVTEMLWCDLKTALHKQMAANVNELTKHY